MRNKKSVFQKFRGQHKLNEGVNLVNITLYGQADYYYALSCQILESIMAKGVLTDEQKKRNR